MSNATCGERHGIPPPRVGNGMSENYMRKYLPGGYDGGEPVEAVMKKGDVMCVHSLQLKIS